MYRKRQRYRSYRKKRQGYSSYPKINRRAIGFYTDSKGRHRPITPSKGKTRLPKSYIPKKVQLLKPHVEDVIPRILYGMLIPKEICATIALADSLYTNWNSIHQLFEEYQRGGIQSVVRRIETETDRTAISSIQTEAIWATISGYIPREYQNISKEMLSNFMNTVTTAEIALAKQFLQQRG